MLITDIKKKLFIGSQKYDKTDNFTSDLRKLVETWDSCRETSVS